VYTSSGNMQALLDAAGGRHFIKVGAHYGYGPHICGPHTCGYPQVDWTQWNDYGAGGQNVDQLVGSYLPGKPTPIPVPPDITIGENMIAVATNTDGRLEVFVETQSPGKGKSGTVLHAYQDKAGGGWNGAIAGKQTAAWHNLGTPAP
jgi:hypothetical protein